MTSDELTCQELVELVTEYLEGTLSAHQRALFEQHLSQCGGCRTYLEQMRQTIQLTGRLTEEAIPAPARQELIDLFQKWKKS